LGTGLPGPEEEEASGVGEPEDVARGSGAGGPAEDDVSSIFDCKKFVKAIFIPKNPLPWNRALATLGFTRAYHDISMYLPGVFAFGKAF
jgi:hypothetical protein